MGGLLTISRLHEGALRCAFTLRQATALSGPALCIWRAHLVRSISARVHSLAVGILFVDLPANMVGCFFMGLLSPSDVLEQLALRKPARGRRKGSRGGRSGSSHSCDDGGDVDGGNSKGNSGSGGSSSGSGSGNTAAALAGRQFEGSSRGGGWLGSDCSSGSAPAFFMPAPEDMHRAIAALPGSSPVQKHASLLLGLRTGFCGSLTTFASWVSGLSLCD